MDDDQDLLLVSIQSVIRTLPIIHVTDLEVEVLQKQYLDARYSSGHLLILGLPLLALALLPVQLLVILVWLQFLLDHVGPLVEYLASVSKPLLRLLGVYGLVSLVAG